jgi:hypothetical protein
LIRRGIDQEHHWRNIFRLDAEVDGGIPRNVSQHIRVYWYPGSAFSTSNAIDYAMLSRTSHNRGTPKFILS